MRLIIYYISKWLRSSQSLQAKGVAHAVINLITDTKWPDLQVTIAAVENCMGMTLVITMNTACYTVTNCEGNTLLWRLPDLSSQSSDSFPNSLLISSIFQVSFFFSYAICKSRTRTVTKCSHVLATNSFLITCRKLQAMKNWMVGMG